MPWCRLADSRGARGGGGILTLTPFVPTYRVVGITRWTKTFVMCSKRLVAVPNKSQTCIWTPNVTGRHRAVDTKKAENKDSIEIPQTMSVANLKS